MKETEHLIGDGPLDALGTAVSNILTEYQTAFRRRPTKAEWEALLRTVLSAEQPRWRPLDSGLVRGVSLDVA